ncbi:glycine-rich domain-containing protein [Anaerotruncus massiliensis (ex Liu et al. 2021)]|uniref:glycine-rich domain-containing protein n=1 Tax=Anaerotruncus massiliensis (ex Liu et al. 2021) TaxID=2321404 RepID=UPI003AF5702A
MLTSCFPSGGGSSSPGGWVDVPQFTYTGQSEVIVEEGVGWKIRFLTSGTFTLVSPDRMMIDAFLVGGGGGGANSRNSTSSYSGGGGGGGGGFTGTYFAQIEKDIPFEIIIGAGGVEGKNGGVSSAFAYSVEGGYGAVNNFGGKGGNNGGNGMISYGDGKGGASNGDPGQGTTTREFGEVNSEDYAGGGGGGGFGNDENRLKAGGNGGANGGEGGNASNSYLSGRPGSDIEGKGGKGGSGASSYGVYGGGGGGGGNYGGGGGGSGIALGGGYYGYANGGAGGQGIVIIRDHRVQEVV